MTTRRTTHAKLTAAVVLALASIATVDRATAQPDELRAVMRIESPGQGAMDMIYFLRGNQLRMDVSEEASIVWTGGAESSMLMIQHPERQYMEWGPDQMRMMRQMLGRIPGGGATTGQDSDFDPTRITFEETGQRGPVGDWDAFEVRMTVPDEPPTMLWLTTDTDVGLFDLSLRVADAASALQMPMAGGGAPSAQELARYRAVADAQGLPEGRVVRIVTSDDGQGTQITLTTVEPGTLPADTFDPPAGYDEMQMPSFSGGIPGIPGRD